MLLRSVKNIFLVGLLIAAASAIIPFDLAYASGEDGVKEIVIQARQNGYEPSVIRVAKGDRVRIVLKAMDVTHGLYVDDYAIETRAIPGRPEQVEFTADRPGEFRIRCIQPCGPLHPFLVGKLIVEPDQPFHLGLGLTSLLPLAFGGLLLLKKRRSVVGDQNEKTSGSAWRWVLAKRSGGGRRSGALFSLLDVPGIGSLLRWRGFQFLFMLPFVFFLTLAIVAGFAGTPVGSHNFGTVFIWLLWWPLLLLLLVPLGGRLWCAVCPLAAPGEWLQRLAFIGKREGRLLSLERRWPARLRNIWLQNSAFLIIALFSAVILTTPRATAFVLAALVVLGIVLALVFAGRAFCRYVCPLGGFIGLCSMVSPLAVRVKNGGICRDHQEKQCLKGSCEGYGCPWFEYPGAMNRNAYCGLCMECVKTCSKDNIAVGLQAPGRDLVVGRRRLDEAYRSFIAIGSAGLYAAVMLGPWNWLKSLVINPLAPGFALYAALLLGTSLIVVPGLFMIVAWLSKIASDSDKARVVSIWKDFSYGLVPLALSAWMAFALSILLIGSHYAVSTLSDPLGHGWDLFGTASFEGRPVLTTLLPYLQITLLLGGLLFSMRIVWRLAWQTYGRWSETVRGVAPVIGFLAATTAIFLWLFVG